MSTHGSPTFQALRRRRADELASIAAFAAAHGVRSFTPDGAGGWRVERLRA